MVELLIDQSFTDKEIVARLEQAKRTPMVNKLYLNKVDLNNSVTSTSPSSSGDGDDDDNVDVGDNECDVVLALKRLFQEDNTSPFSRKRNLMMQEEAAASTSITTTTPRNTEESSTRIWELIQFSSCSGPIYDIMPYVEQCNVKEIVYCEDRDDDSDYLVGSSSSDGDPNNTNTIDAIMTISTQQLLRMLKATAAASASAASATATTQKGHESETVTPSHSYSSASSIDIDVDTETYVSNTRKFILNANERLSIAAGCMTASSSDDSTSTCSSTNSNLSLLLADPNYYMNTKKGMLEWIISHPTCTKVTLGNLILSNECAMDISQNLVAAATDGSCSSLQSLKLFCTLFLESEAIETIAHGLQYATANYLTSLELSDCSLTDPQIEEIISAMNQAIPKNITVGKSKLQKLRINGNYCGVNGMEAISKLLSSSSIHKNLVELDLSDQLNALQYDRGYGIGDDDNDDGNNVLTSILLPVLKHDNRTLQTLSLRECNINDKDLDGIVSTLCSNPILESVDIRYNRITSYGVKNIFAKNLVSMTGLKRIFLRQGIGVALQDDVRDALIEGLKVNYSLQKMDLFEWVTEIEYYIDLNRSGRCLLRDYYKNGCGDNSRPVSIQSGLWPHVLERIPLVIEGNSGRRRLKYGLQAQNDDFATKFKNDHNRYQHHHFFQHSLEKRTKRMRKDTIRKANALYYFLREGPLLVER